VVDTTRLGLLDLAAPEEVAARLERQGRLLVDESAARADAHRVDVVTTVARGDPSHEIVARAAEDGADLVVMPTHGRRGLGRLLLGSTTEGVLHGAETLVLTVRPAAETRVAFPYRSVLVATDGSPAADHALDHGVAVAGETGAALHLLSVAETGSVPGVGRTESAREALTAAAELIVEDAATRAEAAGVAPVDAAVVAGASVHGTIEEYVEHEGVSLVVVGTHGLTGLERVLGGVTDHLVRTATVPVLVVARERD
jgi:nucleotide-binding universal stress UspA family protein